MFLFLWREDKRKNLLILALVFILAEIATCAASTVVDALVYSPSQNKVLALYIDMVILLVGVAVLWVTHKSNEPEAEKKEPEEKP